MPTKHKPGWWNSRFIDEKTGFSQEEVERSVYYWWWEYLRQNEEYKCHCFKPEHEPNQNQFETVFADFGNIFEDDFQAWWRHQGRKLFSGTYIKEHMIYSSDYEQLHPEWLDKNSTYIFAIVPMQNSSKRDLKRQFSKMLDKYHFSKRGIRIGRPGDTQKYLPLGRPNINGLKTHLKVYKVYKENRRLAYWKIAQKVWPTKNGYGIANPDLATRNAMSSVVKRHLDKANALIHNVGLGRFPDYTSPKQ